jgi:hypothetical protein
MKNNKKKFYQTDSFKTGLCVAIGVIIYKIITEIFLK